MLAAVVDAVLRLVIDVVASRALGGCLGRRTATSAAVPPGEPGARAEVPVVGGRPADRSRRQAPPVLLRGRPGRRLEAALQTVGATPIW